MTTMTTTTRQDERGLLMLYIHTHPYIYITYTGQRAEDAERTTREVGG
jgi:hypothetical protein